MKYIRRITRIIVSNFFRSFLYLLSLFWPRRKNRWVFGAGKRSFTDNAKYLFLYVANNCDDIEVAWIARNKEVIKKLNSMGYKSYHIWSLAGINYCLTAKLYIFSSKSSDINYWTSGGAIHFNLWHGVGIKNIEYEIKTGPIKKHFQSKIARIAHPEDFRKPDYFLSTSKEMTAHFKKCFRIERGNIFESGYPRNEILVGSYYSYPGVIDNEISTVLNNISGRKSFLYMPTFRDSNKALNESVLDLDKLENLNKEKNSIFLMKVHPNTRFKAKKSTYDTIVFLDKRMDVYPLLRHVDVLITDYSSVFYDFLLTGKPTIFYIYDYKEYISDNRDLAMPFMDNIAGEICYSFSDLMVAMSNLKKTSTEKSDFLIKKFWGENYSDASKNITSFIKSKVI